MTTQRALAMLQWFIGRGPQGGTTDECETALGLRNLHTRATELVRAGRLITTGKTRLTRARRPAVVYVYRDTDVPLQVAKRPRKAELTSQDAKLLAAARHYVKARSRARSDTQAKAIILKLLRALDTTTWSP